MIGRDLLRAEETDHVNQDSLDDRRFNLRIATRAENNRNRNLQKNNSSGFIGVSRLNRLRRRPWQAYIKAGGKTIHLGYFATPEQAANAYNQAARLHHGELATLNPA